MSKKIIVVGSGNAAFCAALAALKNGASVLMLEKADPELAGGNTRYTAGAMRFAYDGRDDILPLIRDPSDPRLPLTDFGSYPAQKFTEDLLLFNGERPLSPEQTALIHESTATLHWLAGHGVKFEPIYSRQSFEKDGRYIFWGGLTLAAMNEGVGLIDMEQAAFNRLGGDIRYECAVKDLIVENGEVVGVETETETIWADAVILASGGFEASQDLRTRYIGPHWAQAKVRGTPHNTGDGLRMALAAGAREHGLYQGCHATPMDFTTPDYGGLHLPAHQRKNYRKICYFLGIMLNKAGQRFVDEGINFRNYTYAQFGKAILEQPGQMAWQIFDSKVFDLLYEEYRFQEAHYIESDDLGSLIHQLDGLDSSPALQTIHAFNQAVDEKTAFDPTCLDGKGTPSLALKKSNWAQRLDTPPFRAYPVTGGITFTYGGLKIDEKGSVLGENDTIIPNLYACGELVGGVFFEGYPGGSGLTSGAVFGKRAGTGAATSP